MKKFSFLLTLVAISFQASFTFSQAPSIEWQKPIGGFKKDFPTGIVPGTDGGFVIAGVTSSNDGYVVGNHGDDDVLVIKVDDSGNLIWQKCFGGDTTEFASDIKQTPDGGYVIAGYTYSNDGDVSGNHSNNADGWIIKLNSLGTLEWQKCLGGSEEDIAYSIDLYKDEGYIVALRTNSTDGDVVDKNGGTDYWIVKLDLYGQIVSQECLGGHKNESPASLIVDQDANTVVAGYSFSHNGDVSQNHGKSDFWIVKLDTSLNIIWQRSYGGTKEDQITGLGTSLEQCTDGGYIIAGYTASNNGDVSGNHGSIDIWIIKIDVDGNLLWQKCLGGSGVDDVFAIKEEEDGGYIVAGSTKSNDGNVIGNHGEADAWIVRLDIYGDTIWQKTYGGSLVDEGLTIWITGTDEYLIAGGSFSNDWDVSGNYGAEDLWLVKLSLGVATGVEEIENTFLPYPNPATDMLTIPIKNPVHLEEFKIYDILGHMMHVPVSITDSQIVLDISALPAGFYEAVIRKQGFRFVKF